MGAMFWNVFIISVSQLMKKRTLFCNGSPSICPCPLNLIDEKANKFFFSFSTIRFPLFEV